MSLPWHCWTLERGGEGKRESLPYPSKAQEKPLWSLNVMMKYLYIWEGAEIPEHIIPDTRLVEDRLPAAENINDTNSFNGLLWAIISLVMEQSALHFVQHSSKKRFIHIYTLWPY